MILSATSKAPLIIRKTLLQQHLEKSEEFPDIRIAFKSQEYAQIP